MSELWRGCSPMVLKQDNPNIKLNDFGAINAMMKISN